MALSPYYYVYIAILATVATLSEHTKISKKYVIRKEFFIFITWVFFAFRSNAGFDYIYYEDMILKNDGLDVFEPIPRLVAEISNSVHSFRPFVIYTATAYIFGLYKLLKNKTNLSFFMLSILLWTPFGFFENFSWMRQSAAIGFFLVGYTEWVENKKKTGTLWFLIAILNHYSIITPIIATIFVTAVSQKSKIRLSKIALLITMIECTFHPISNGIINASEIMPYANYLSASNEYGQFGFLMWAAMIIGSVLFFVSTKSNKIQENANFFIMSAIGLMFYSIFFPFGQHACRIFMAFAPIAALAIAIIANLFKPKIIIYIIFLAFATLGTTYRLTSSASSASDYDYLNKYELNI